MKAARKDFSEVVVQAQKEISKLTTVEEPNDTTKAEETDIASSTVGSSSTDASAAISASSTLDKETPTPSTSMITLFSRLQSALPPNIVSAVQDRLPDSLKQASENIDFSQLGTHLMSEFQRVQGVTRAQAEEYVLKSEVLIRDAMKEAGEVLRDAVKVIPPDQAGSSEGLIWDGTDMWMLPADSSDAIGSSRNIETQSAVATRAEALLRRLKRDPAILRHDPEADKGTRDEYHAWWEGEVNNREGGIDGQEWSSKIAAVLEEPLDGPALKELRDILGKFLIFLMVIQIFNI